MDKLQLVLLIFSFVCFVIAAWGAAQAQPHYGRLIAAGLAFFSAAFIFGGAMKLFGGP
jgi:hypothetical protein